MVVALIITQEWASLGRRSPNPRKPRLGSVTTPFFILFGIGALIGTWNHVRHDPDHGLLWHSFAPSGLFLCRDVSHLLL